MTLNKRYATRREPSTLHAWLLCEVEYFIKQSHARWGQSGTADILIKLSFVNVTTVYSIKLHECTCTLNMTAWVYPCNTQNRLPKVHTPLIKPWIVTRQSTEASCEKVFGKAQCQLRCVHALFTTLVTTSWWGSNSSFRRFIIYTYVVLQNPSN